MSRDGSTDLPLALFVALVLAFGVYSNRPVDVESTTTATEYIVDNTP